MFKFLVAFITSLTLPTVIFARTVDFECLTGKPETVAYDSAIVFYAKMNFSKQTPVLIYRHREFPGYSSDEGYQFFINLKNISTLKIQYIDRLGTGMSYSKASLNDQLVYCL
ncbi:MAG TPA: hypothetical protein VIG33_06500 [Pseudobdellovibrionaceae bacterium]|jgi:hypothetical protein